MTVRRSSGRWPAHRSYARSVSDSVTCLPHPEPLLQDLYSALFKLNVVLRAERELSPAVLINRGVLQVLLDSGSFDVLRRRTELDERNAGAAAVLLGRKVLEALRREFRHEPEALLHAAEAARTEESLEAKQRELEHLRDSEAFDPSQREDLEGELEDEIRSAQARLARDRRRQRKAAETASRVEAAVDAAVDQLPEQIDEPQRQARGLGVGGVSNVDADRRLELGNRIMRSSKLKRLAQLVGAMRDAAFETRRRRAANAPEEVHAVSRGDDIARLLPAEMLGLKDSLGGRVGRALHLDFLRRLAEKQLLQYELQAPSERGPMVVCLDGSGSMQGAKELWGKAVALTLMEIARRERRRCMALVFSDGPALFEVELLAPNARGLRARVQDDEVLRFAEHFPGGGTDFEPPLRRALESVTKGNYKRGDIVFITDGHAPVSSELVARIETLRKRYRFKIRGVLVDVADHEQSSLAAFADDIRCVSDLASDSVQGLFAAV